MRAERRGRGDWGKDITGGRGDEKSAAETKKQGLKAECSQSL